MEFENYTDTSKKYDQYRIPIGLDSLTKAINFSSETQGTKPSNLKLLDVGCGTGNYIN